MVRFGNFDFGGGDQPDFGNLSDFFGPGQLDAMVRQCIQMAWAVMPPEKKNLDDVEREFRRLVDRAFRDLREDQDAMGN